MPVIFHGPSMLRIRPGQTVVLDAGDSESPDGTQLSFDWFWYPEAADAPIDAVLSGENTARVSVKIQTEGTFHLILAVKGGRFLPLCRY